MWFLERRFPAGKWSLNSRLLLILLTLVARSGLAQEDAAPRVPRFMQGRLTHSSGDTAVDDGRYTLRFELYDEESGGAPLWSETHEDVLVIGGGFNVALGSLVALPDALPEGPLFLQVQHVAIRTKLADDGEVMAQVSSTQANLTMREPSERPIAPQAVEHAPIASMEEPPKQASEGKHGDLLITPSGYLEFFYSHNFNRPANNVTALRGFDFINGSLMVGNFVMALDASYRNFSARLAINVGANPSQFYEQEPATTPSYQVPVMDRHTWQFIQEALLGWQVPWVNGLTLQAGVMATPIGIEGLPNHQSWRDSMQSPHMLPKDYRENWNWSRSNSFINVPDYHSGVRALYSLNDKHHFGAFLLNGQNANTDNNDGKTFAASYLYLPSPSFHMSALYMGGPERNRGAPEGQGLRHLFDYCLRWELTKNWHFMTQFAPGFENTRFGTNWWTINAVYASYKFDNGVRLAVRYEHLLERVSPGSSPVFLRSIGSSGTAGLYGVTGTLSVPIVPNHLMLRLEYRRDWSEQNWFYKGALEASDNRHEPFIPNAKLQNTATAGLVGWF